MYGYGSLRFHLDYDDKNNTFEIIPSNIKTAKIEYTMPSRGFVELDLDKTNLAQFFNYQGSNGPSPSSQPAKDFIIKIFADIIDMDLHTINLTLTTDFGILTASADTSTGENINIQTEDGYSQQIEYSITGDSFDLNTIKLCLVNDNNAIIDFSKIFSDYGGLEGSKIIGSSINTSQCIGEFESVVESLGFDAILNYQITTPCVTTTNGKTYNTTLKNMQLTDTSTGIVYAQFENFPVIVNPELYR